MAANDPRAGSAPGNPDRIPATIVFAEPPGVGGALDVAAEEGAIAVHRELVGRAFCAVVLTLDARSTCPSGSARA
jgi:hypothetical protein